MGKAFEGLHLVVSLTFRASIDCFARLSYQGDSHVAYRVEDATSHVAIVDSLHLLPSTLLSSISIWQDGVVTVPQQWIRAYATAIINAQPVRTAFVWVDHGDTGDAYNHENGRISWGTMHSCAGGASSPRHLQGHIPEPGLPVAAVTSGESTAASEWI